MQQVSDYGCSAPAVARTFLQGVDILSHFNCDAETIEQAKEVLYEFQGHMIRCTRDHDLIAKKVQEGMVKGLVVSDDGRGVDLPSVPDIKSHAESFLQGMKLAVQCPGRLVKPFYHVDHNHHYHKLKAWAENKFGKDDPMTETFRRWEPWVVQWLANRDSVEHPDPSKRLCVRNFDYRKVGSKIELVEPRWSFGNRPFGAIVAETDHVIEGLLRLGECVLIELFYKHKNNFPTVIEVIEPKDRNPECPMRLRVGLDPTSLVS